LPAAERAPLPDLAADLALIREAAEEAGKLALGFYRRDPEVWYKNHGRSPVSEADIAVDRLLRQRLVAARPDYGWLSEESGSASDWAGRDTLFVVDPIDGTRGFIAGKDVWCVSVAVVHRGVSVAGVLVAPATGEVFTACASGPAMKTGRPIAVSVPAAADGGRMVVAAPERIMARLPDDLKAMISTVGSIPSLAYRLAMVADGRLHATLVRENANDWDIAAADIILRRAGGTLVQRGGTPVVFGKNDAGHGILLAASNTLLPQLTEAMEQLSGH